MNWSSFFIGVLVGVLIGWLIEWLIDLFYWRRRLRALQQANADVQAQLAKSEQENQALQTLVNRSQEQEKELAGCRADLQAKASELAGCRGELQARENELIGCRAHLRAKEGELSGCQAGLQAKENELQTTASQLSQAIRDRDALREQLAGQEQQVKVYTDKLQTLENTLASRTNELTIATEKLAAAPVAAPAIPIEPDDLEKIEGIGPKIQGLLNHYGIVTFKQLADILPEQLREVLEKGGRHFKLADPTAWPQQARLAANGDWEGLQKLQDELLGGRVVSEPEEETQ